MTDSGKVLKAQVNQTLIELVLGRIELAETDAIVNAANTSLLGGGGVDGAIHRAAGAGLLAECQQLNGCDTGDAKITGGYHLKAKYVIHAVGPIYGTPDANALLEKVYWRSLQVALEKEDIHSIAFPAISTGAYMYPMAVAGEIALTTVCNVIANQTQIQLVQFVLFDKTPETFDIFANTLRAIAQKRTDITLL